MPKKTLDDIKKIYNERENRPEWGQAREAVRMLSTILGAMGYQTSKRSNKFSFLDKLYTSVNKLFETPDTAEKEKKIQEGLDELPEVVNFLKDPKNAPLLKEAFDISANEVGYDSAMELSAEMDNCLNTIVDFYEPEIEAEQKEVVEEEEHKAPEEKKNAEPKAPEEKKNAEPKAGSENKELKAPEEAPKAPAKAPEEYYRTINDVMGRIKPGSLKTDENRARFLNVCLSANLLLNRREIQDKIVISERFKLINGETREVKISSRNQALETINKDLEPLLNTKEGDVSIREMLMANAKNDQEKKDLTEALAFAEAESKKYAPKPKQADKQKKSENVINISNRDYFNIISNHTGSIFLNTVNEDLAKSLMAYNYDQKKVPYEEQKFNKAVNSLMKKDYYKAFVKNPDFRAYCIKNRALNTAAASLGTFEKKYSRDESGMLPYSYENYIWKHTGPNANYSDYKGDLAKLLAAKRLQEQKKPFSIDAIHAAAKEIQNSPSFKKLDRNKAAEALFKTDPQMAEKLLSEHRKTIENENRQIAANGPIRGDKKTFGGYIYKHTHGQIPAGRAQEYLAKVVAANRLMQKDVPFSVKELRREAEKVMNEPVFRENVKNENTARNMLQEGQGKLILDKYKEAAEAKKNLQQEGAQPGLQ